MEKRRMSLKTLRGLVEKCLNEGISLAFFEPETETRESVSEEVKEAVTMGYATALHDVLEAIDGKPSALKDAASEHGRFAIRPEDLPLYEKEMMEESEEK